MWHLILCKLIILVVRSFWKKKQNILKLSDTEWKDKAPWNTYYFFFQIQRECYLSFCLIYIVNGKFTQLFSLHILPSPSPLARRSIASYSIHKLISPSTCYSQPYLQFLSPQPTEKPLPDPTLALAGYHPPYHLPKRVLPHTHRFLTTLYTTNSTYYRALRQALIKPSW